MARRKFAPEQTTYMMAKAAYQVVEENYKQLLAPTIARDRDHNIPDEEFVELTMKADKDAGLTAAYTHLHKAEKELVAWAQAKLQKHDPAKWAKVADVFQIAPRRTDWMAKLVDICMRLQA
jgi:hypothetical protein